MCGSRRESGGVRAHLGVAEPAGSVSPDTSRLVSPSSPERRDVGPSDARCRQRGQCGRPADRRAGAHRQGILPAERQRRHLTKVRRERYPKAGRTTGPVSPVRTRRWRSQNAPTSSAFLCGKEVRCCLATTRVQRRPRSSRSRACRCRDTVGRKARIAPSRPKSTQAISRQERILGTAHWKRYSRAGALPGDGRRTRRRCRCWRCHPAETRGRTRVPYRRESRSPAYRGPASTPDASLEFKPWVTNTPIGPERSDRNAMRESSGAQVGNMFCPSYVWRSVLDTWGRTHPE